MLEIRPTCENCGKELPPDSDEAYICSFECTYCLTCVEEVLHNVCPNCTGGFTPRPIRPTKMLLKYPESIKVVSQPVDINKQAGLIEKYNNVAPSER